jgi:hypothetical protein
MVSGKKTQQQQTNKQTNKQTKKPTWYSHWEVIVWCMLFVEVGQLRAGRVQHDVLTACSTRCRTKARFSIYLSTHPVTAQHFFF